MMGDLKPTFATITTAPYLAFVLAQHESLQQFLHESFCHYVLCLDDESVDLLGSSSDPTLQPVSWRSVATEEYLRKKFEYAAEISLFCFLSKPFFLRHLLEQTEAAAIVYLDADMICFADPSSLFQKHLQENDICLTPHASLGEFQKYASLNGLINGGFVGVTKRALNFVCWWEARCFEKCQWDRSLPPAEGGAVDQGYLEKAKLLFPRVGYLSSRFNTAIWNCERITETDLGIWSEFGPITFFHFASHKLEHWQLHRHKLLMQRDSKASLYNHFNQMLSQAIVRQGLQRKIAESERSLS